MEHQVLREPMSVLVTGGAGYIGSHMVHELADAGERVVVLDNLSTGFDWAVAKHVPLVIGDTGDQNLVGQIIRQHKKSNRSSILLLRP
jgi:UDP-glucose 4-epimerase